MTSPTSPASVGITTSDRSGLEPFGSDAGGEAPNSTGADFNPPVDVCHTAPAEPGAPASLLIPEAGAPELDFIPVAAAEDMLRVRHEQIHRFGHTPEADRTRPPQALAYDIESLARAIIEDCQFHKPASRIRRRTIKLGALCMALADRLEFEIIDGEE